MAEIKINCPNCGKRITLSEAFTHQLEEEIGDRLQVEAQEIYEKKLAEETAKFQKEMNLENERIKRKIEESHSLELIEQCA